MDKFKIVASLKDKLVIDVASRLKRNCIMLEIESFADTESVIKFDQKYNFSGATVVLCYQFMSLSSSSSLYSVNNEFMKFLLCVHAFKSYSVKKIIGFLPYLPYSRQEGDGGSAAISLVGSLCKAAGIDALITSDVHSSAVQRKIGLPFDSSDMSPFWAKILKERVFLDAKKNYCVASPDAGGSSRARAVADILGCEVVSMNKERISPDHAHVLTLDGDVTGKVVVIVDDILDTGRTALSACELLLRSGAVEVIGCFTHPVLSSGAVERLIRSQFSKIFVTDTLILQSHDLPDKITVVSVGDFFAEVLPDYISTVS